MAIWGIWGEPSWDLWAGVSTWVSKALVVQERAGVGREGLGARSQLPPCCPNSVRSSKVPQNSHLASRRLRRYAFALWADRTHFLQQLVNLICTFSVFRPMMCGLLFVLLPQALQGCGVGLQYPNILCLASMLGVLCVFLNFLE